MKYIRIHVYEYIDRIFAGNLLYRDKKTKCISKFSKNIAAMASESPSPLPPSLRLDLAAHQLSRRNHAQSLLGPSFHDPRTLHVLESHSEPAAPLSRRDNERRHAVGSHSTLALHLCLLLVIFPHAFFEHLCSNLFQTRAIVIPFHSCLIMETQSNQRHFTQKAQHKYQDGSIFLLLPRNYTKVKVIVDSLW